MSASKNYIENVAIVGAGGQLGAYIVDHLLKTGKHKITAITRADSTSSMPAGVSVKKANYTEPSSLAEALKGQDALIITMAVTAPRDTSQKLFEAAAAAGVPWVIPNEWGLDTSNVELGQDTGLGPPLLANRAAIEKLDVSSWVSVTCSFWYEFSLGGSADRFGFDFPNRSITFFDEGTTNINTSTFPQCARAVTSLLSLKVQPDDTHDKTETLSKFKNKPAYISSFNISQKDMFESVKRVTGTTDADWKIAYEPSKTRFEDASADFKAGNFHAIGKKMYSRVFYPNGDGDFEATRGLDNGVLGLPKEDLDEFTKKGIEMSEGVIASYAARVKLMKGGRH